MPLTNIQLKVGMAANSTATKLLRTTALKDTDLRYRACTQGYARLLQHDSSPTLVGRSDADFLSADYAEHLRQIERRVLRSRVPDVTPGDKISERAVGKWFVRTPVISRNGEVTGLQVQVVAIDDLPHTHKWLVTSGLQLRTMLQDCPFGLLVHQQHQPLYVNDRWYTLLDRPLESRPLLDAQHQWLPADVKTEEISHAEIACGDGTRRQIEFRSKRIAWNGEDAVAVLGIEVNAAALAHVVPVPEPEKFVEKRRGPRRDPSLQLSGEQSLAEVELFNAIRHPVIVCDNWVPVYKNKAAESLLAGGDWESGSVESWFNDREKSEVEQLLREREVGLPPVPALVLLGGQRYSASLSPVTWSGRSAVLLSLQQTKVSQNELDERDREVRKLEDFAASAGDFLWEMDRDLCITHLSMEVKPMLGVSSDAISGIPLDTLIEQYIHVDDIAEWSVVSVDMRKHLPFRDREFKWLHRDGHKRVVRLSGRPVFAEDKTFLGYRGIGSDYTAEYQKASAVAYHASHDALTGLVNRREFESRCDEAIRSVRSGASTHALCFLDLDKFKIVNDTCGHLAGDELLRQLSSMFTGLVRKSDVLARLGGDEFGVLIFDVGIKEALRLADQLRAEVESFQFLWGSRRFTIGVSIGLVIVDARWESRSAVFSAADSACYEAKNKGRNRVAIYNESESTRPPQGERQWVDLVSSAIADRRVQLAMQKVVDLQSSSGAQREQISRASLFMRIQNAEGGILEPSAFLPAADRYGLCAELDLAVIDAAFDWLGSQPHVAESMEMCAMTLSEKSIIDPDFTQALIERLKRVRFDVSILTFEVTESVAISNLSAVTQFMKRVGESGCKFTLSDVGGSLSSLAYFKNLPITYLKIDGMFVRDILEDPIDFAMVKAINEIGQSLGKITIAEHVENEAVLDKLALMGVNLAQGYHIGSPEIIDF